MPLVLRGVIYNNAYDLQMSKCPWNVSESLKQIQNHLSWAIDMDSSFYLFLIDEAGITMLRDNMAFGYPLSKGRAFDQPIIIKKQNQQWLHAADGRVLSLLKVLELAIL